MITVILVILTILTALWLLTLGILIGLKISENSVDEAIKLCQETNDMWHKFCGRFLDDLEKTFNEGDGENDE